MLIFIIIGHTKRCEVDLLTFRKMHFKDSNSNFLTDYKNVDKYKTQLFSFLSFSLQYLKMVQKRSKVQYSWFLQKCYNSFVEISCFELWTVFRQFLGTVVKNAKHIKVAPGIYLHFCNQSKNLSVIILVLKICFPKICIFWTQVKTWTSTWHCLLGENKKSKSQSKSPKWSVELVCNFLHLFEKKLEISL